MSVSVTSNHFEGRDKAIELIEEHGLFARDGAMQSGDLEDVHWHKSSLQIYVLGGSFETRDVVLDTTLLAGRGDLVSIPARTLHAARCPSPATYVVGFESEEAARSFRPEMPSDLGQDDA